MKNIVIIGCGSGIGFSHRKAITKRSVNHRNF